MKTSPVTQHGAAKITKPTGAIYEQFSPNRYYKVTYSSNNHDNSNKETV